MLMAHMHQFSFKALFASFSNSTSVLPVEKLWNPASQRIFTFAGCGASDFATMTCLSTFRRAVAFVH